MTTFVDFNLKLSVIDVLMYGFHPRLPPWSLERALEARGVTGDLWAYSIDNYPDQIVPEARAYFERLDLPGDLLGGIEELNFDGGCRVYFECCPH
ncbi:MAG: hypothetical protein JWN03_7993 [Nocardia sp.]|nr:hypothetical protein [Nocardia sp.]MCU1647718.1 hypothetical protein [Nocardia sp.]